MASEGVNNPTKGRMNVMMLRGQGFVWNIEDIVRLRKEYRILGSTVGAGTRHIREDPGPPLLLTHQEIQVLQEEGIIQLVENRALQDHPSKAVLEQALKYRESSYQKQVEIFKEEKTKNILSFADRIVEGKKKKLMNKLKKKMSIEANKEDSDKNIIKIDREEVIREEIEKIKPISRDHQVVQMFTEDPWRGSMITPTEWEYPTGDLEKCRLLAFRSLWKQGYYVGEGSKFGGDYLVYLGDPVRYHAKYIVLCVGEDNSKFIRAQDKVSKSRLGNQVRKTVLVAELKDGNLEFNSYTRNLDSNSG